MEAVGRNWTRNVTRLKGAILETVEQNDKGSAHIKSWSWNGSGRFIRGTLANDYGAQIWSNALKHARIQFITNHISNWSSKKFDTKCSSIGDQKQVDLGNGLSDTKMPS